jgi:outer membrane protein OmpU
MKNVLFATTALVLTAGVASAEVTFSGTAAAGVVQANGAADMRVFNGMDIAISATATSDSGVTVTVADDIGGGDTVDWNDDYAIDSQRGDIGDPSVTLVAGGVTVVFDDDSIDHLDSDAATGDVSIATSMGDANVAVVLDVDQSSGTDFSISAGYTMGGVSLSASMQDDSNNIGASYTMGNITVGVSTDDNGNGLRTNEGTVSYTAGAVTLSAAADDQDAWSVDVSYTAGAMSAAFGTDNNEEWDANVSYDLGGGVTMFGSTNHDEFMAAGINFSF